MKQRDLDGNGIIYKRGARVVQVDLSSHVVILESGEALKYEKLLIATGAEPTLPPIPGLQRAPFYVLRTIKQAKQLRLTALNSKSAIVLGAGLIGMHTAENLANAGLDVTVLESLPHVLPGYFDKETGELIKKIFLQKGVHILTGSVVVRISSSNSSCVLSLESGEDLSADLLVVATGVQPRLSCVAGSEMQLERGILVDENIRTSVKDIWAAGDVAQARSFFDSSKVVHGNLPTAVEQGRIAGFDMVCDPTLKPYPGGIPMNIFKFFSHRSFSVGLVDTAESYGDIEIDRTFLSASQQYQKLLYQKNRLVGVSAINSTLDPGIMYQLIKRKVDLTGLKKLFSTAPCEVGRLLMSRTWA